MKGQKRSKAFATHAKMIKIIEMIVLLQSSRFTISDLALRFNQSERSVYRYLSAMEALDFPVEKDFSGKYFICDTTTCPLCGRAKE